jgi:hypothetical protein
MDAEDKQALKTLRDQTKYLTQWSVARLIVGIVQAFFLLGIFMALAGQQ